MESLTENYRVANVTNFQNVTSVEMLLGPKSDTFYVVIPITVIYVIIFITGLIGNISTCVVISRNKSMHTATNYYLYSLAISDLLLLISGLPQEMYSIWSRYPYIFGHTFCILRGLFSETSANSTVLTITTFTVERYLAICHPFLSHTMSKLSRAIKLILIIWLVSICFAIPQALQFEVSSMIEGIPESNMCHVAHVIIPHSFEFSTFVFFIGPMSLITVLYALIGFRLRSSNRMTNSSRGYASRSTVLVTSNNGRNGTLKQKQGQSSRRVLKMLVAVVVAFFVCWAPFHVQRLMAIYGTIPANHKDRKKFFKIYEIVTYISGVFYYLSTTINPLLYNIMSNKFREAFKETFAHYCGNGLIKVEEPQSRNPVLSRSLRCRYDSTTDSTSRDYPSSQTNTTLVHKTSQDSMNIQLTSSYRNNTKCMSKNLEVNRFKINNQQNVITTAQDNEYSEPCDKIFKSYSVRKTNTNVIPFWNFILCNSRRLSDSGNNVPLSSPGQELYDDKKRTSCDISNSSLKDVDSAVLKDELENYLFMTKYQQ